MAENAIIYTVDKTMAGAPEGTEWPGEFVLYPFSGRYLHIEPPAGTANNGEAILAGGGVNGGSISYAQHVGYLAAFTTAAPVVPASD